MVSCEEFSNIIGCYGITKFPITENYIMIMDYKKDRSLRSYLYANVCFLRWSQKLNLLHNAIKGLSEIHKKKIMHNDFHSGNIIFFDDKSYIADFGLCNHVETDSIVFGGLPYIAPEVLCRESFNEAADIYSLGIVTNQVASGYPPYYDRNYDTGLVLQIVNEGLRPNINANVTSQVSKLIQRCWSQNPNDRPTAIELLDKLCSYRQKDNKLWKEIEQIENNINFNISLREASLKYETPKQVFYTSKHYYVPEIDNETSSSSRQNSIQNAKVDHNSSNSIPANNSESTEGLFFSELTIDPILSPAKISTDIDKNWYKTTVKDYKLKEMRFDKFGKIDQIGIDAYGVIYQTTYALTEEKVVVKELFITSDDHESIKIFINEDNETYYLVMEYAEGGTLQQFLRKRVFTYQERIQLALQIVEGMTYLHSINIIHQDLVSLLTDY
ncbi:4269_t:CDS:2 [Racocetra fulgida]|uniref:4269_t:CDS:1 n=1 Tax=Racocetra fulgida TaxID=60492 RepID=A0A9N9F842_9GLOM|nr:4269_t:CDS:2 [Racocetra fulgida]